jgi:hypothetical protein
MKIVISILLILVRIIVGFKILYWLAQELKYPELNSISTIEFYLVFLLFDIWISISHSGIELPNKDS